MSKKPDGHAGGRTGEEWAEPFVVPASVTLTDDDARSLAHGKQMFIEDAPDPQSTILGLIDRLTRADQTHEIVGAVTCLRNASRWLAEHDTKTTPAD